MGLTFRGTDIQTANIFLDVAEGYFEPADVRGSDAVIPGLTGRFALNRIKDHRSLQLVGWVEGTGATLVAQQQSWHTSTLALMALMDRSLAAGSLVLTPPTLGLSAGSKTISARCVNLIPGPVIASRFQRWSIELEAVGNPPDWA